MEEQSYVYVAGRYRPQDGTHDWRGYTEIDENINIARYWAFKLAQEGIPFFCPHLNSGHVESIVPNVPSEFWLEMDLVILKYASALLLVPGWRESKGAVGEKVQAMEQGIPVYTYMMFKTLVREWKEGA